MTYFCDVHLQSKKDQEKRLFIVIPNEDAAKMEIPNLTKELLMNNAQYQEFVGQYKPKLVQVEYTVYSTSAEGLYASTPDTVFLELLESGEMQVIASGLTQAFYGYMYENRLDTQELMQDNVELSEEIEAKIREALASVQD